MSASPLRNGGWFAALFLAGIFVPFFGYLEHLILPDRAADPRLPKPKAKLGLQDWSVAEVSRLRLEAGRASASRRVLLGHHGWMFLGDSDVIRVEEGLNPFEPAELKAWTDRLEKDARELRAHRIWFLVVVAPDKSSIYPEELPDYVRLAGAGRTRTDEFMAACADTHVSCLDLRPALLLAKSQGTQVFQRLDTHWTDLGASKAFSAIDSVLFPPRPQTGHWGASFVSREESGGDLARFLGLQDQLSESLPEVTNVNGVEVPRNPHAEEFFSRELKLDGGDPSGPNVMLFRDSFGTRLLPFLASKSKSLEALWPGRPEIDLARVLRERPQIVILEFVERKLGPSSVD